jgi:hypothetical protein
MAQHCTLSTAILCFCPNHLSHAASTSILRHTPPNTTSAMCTVGNIDSSFTVEVHAMHSKTGRLRMTQEYVIRPCLQWHQCSRGAARQHADSGSPQLSDPQATTLVQACVVYVR